MSLYLEHFGLQQPPFRITPHTDFFFSGANRGSTLEALIYAITREEGIVKVTGEVGSGKTMLCRMLLERLPGDVETLYLANPSLSRHEILGAIADELGITPNDQPTHSLTRALQEALITRYAEGKRVVLLIDEAHAMPDESLEEIRLLSNLDSKAAKLLQIALFAQPELDERLAASHMRQLRERITQHFHLTPFKPADVAAYVEFRLRAAGYRGPNPFSAEALKLIAGNSEGLSRRINILADKALLAAYSGSKHAVGPDEASSAMQDARFLPIQPASPFNPKPWLWALAGGGATALAAAVILFGLPPQPPPLPHNPLAAASEPPRAAVTAAVPGPTSSEHTPPPPPAQPAPTSASDDIPFGPLMREHLVQYAEWIAETPHSRYFIQLLAVDAGRTGEIEGFLARARRVLDPTQLRSYRSGLSGRDRVGVIYGDYSSREEANTALRALPESIKAAQPFPRQVSKLH